MHYTGVRDAKKEKRRENKFQDRGFLLHNKLQPSVGVHKIWRLAFIGAKKSVMRISIGEKRKKMDK